MFLLSWPLFFSLHVIHIAYASYKLWISWNEKLSRTVKIDYFMWSIEFRHLRRILTKNDGEFAEKQERSYEIGGNRQDSRKIERKSVKRWGQYRNVDNNTEKSKKIGEKSTNEIFTVEFHSHQYFIGRQRIYLCYSMSMWNWVPNKPFCSCKQANLISNWARLSKSNK